MSQDRGAHLLRPTLPLEFSHTDKRMLLSTRVALVVEVMEQPGCRVEFEKFRALISRKPQPIGFRFAVSGYADLHSLRVFAKIFGLRPRAEKIPRRLASISSIAILGICHVVNSTCCEVWFAFCRVFQGCLLVSSV